MNFDWKFLYSPNIFQEYWCDLEKPSILKYIDYYVYFLKKSLRKILEKKVDLIYFVLIVIY